MGVRAAHACILPAAAGASPNSAYTSLYALPTHLPVCCCLIPHPPHTRAAGANAADYSLFVNIAVAPNLILASSINIPISKVRPCIEE